jgi:hypothetical protein
VAAAQTVTTFKLGLGVPDPTLPAILGELRRQVDRVENGDLSLAEALLVSQAVSLDAIFHNRLMASFKNFQADHFEAGGLLMTQALRAQAQSRATVEALVYLKHPPSANFIRTPQANIAHGPQQVVNGAPLASGQASPAAAPFADSRARGGESVDRPIEPQLLEAPHGDGLELGATGAAGAAHPALEAVGAEHRAAHGRRQGPGGPQRALRGRKIAGAAHGRR